jgi:hypothetical protein
MTQIRLERLAFTISKASNFETVPSALFAEMEEFTSLSQIGASSDGLSTWVQKKRERFFRTAILNYQINGKGKWNEFNQKKKGKWNVKLRNFPYNT